MRQTRAHDIRLLFVASIWLATLQLIVFARTLLVLIKTSRYLSTGQLFSQGRREKMGPTFSGLLSSLRGSYFPEPPLIVVEDSSFPCCSLVKRGLTILFLLLLRKVFFHSSSRKTQAGNFICGLANRRISSSRHLDVREDAILDSRARCFWREENYRRPCAFPCHWPIFV